MVSKRNEDNGKSYQPIDITLDGKLKVLNEEGKEELIEPYFPFISKI